MNDFIFYFMTWSPSGNDEPYTAFNLKTYCARSFSVAAPTLWNTLPSDIMNSSLVSVSKNKLKTFLFKKAFL